MKQAFASVSWSSQAQQDPTTPSHLISWVWYKDPQGEKNPFFLANDFCFPEENEFLFEQNSLQEHP